MSTFRERNLLFRDQLCRIKRADDPSAEAARHVLVSGCTNQGAYIQFGRDLVLYGLWEALLYAESYEQKGWYSPGTVQGAIDASIKPKGE